MRTSHHIFALIAALLAVTPMASAQWLHQHIPADATMLLSVDLSGDSVGAASGYATGSGYSGRAIYTTNGGMNWEPGQVPDSSRAFVTLRFVAAETAYISGAYNVSPQSGQNTIVSRRSATHERRSPRAIGVERFLDRIGLTGIENYRGLFMATRNAGQTWTTRSVFPDSNHYLIGMSFANPSLGYVTANADPFFGTARILKTTNAGLAWTSLTIPDSIVSLRNILCLDTAIALAVGYEFRNQAFAGVILKTVNGGVTWQRQDFPSVDNFTDISFTDSLTGFAVGVHLPPDSEGAPGGAIYKTTDAGKIWLPVTYQPESALLEGVRFAKGYLTAIVYGEKLQIPDSAGGGTYNSPFVAQTTDGGSTWTEQLLLGISKQNLLIGGRLLSPSSGYLCGGDASTAAVMLHTSNGGITGVRRDIGQPAGNYSLSQNYPNPFNPTTRVSFVIRNSSFVVLKVYDLLGGEVATLVNEPKGPGEYTVEWNAEDMPGGVYYYRLSSGNLAQTRSMLLIR